MTRRVRLKVSGRVQGVGFRPTVYRHAVDTGVYGFVKNTSSGVEIEAEGDDAGIDRFVRLVKEKSPIQSVIDNVRSEDVTVLGDETFQIVSSKGSGNLTVGMPPDLATCPDCLKELMTPGDRRFGYPFINCTNCGPRYTIIHSLPYDRERTSMAVFDMCGACSSEYANPSDRRFDAQPDACSDCGPELSLRDSVGKRLDGDPLLKAVELLKEGVIVAVKGLGGYHLCCDALNEGAIRVLRKRKNRPHKSLAVMFSSIVQAQEYCVIDEAQRTELQDVARPIVIVSKDGEKKLPGLMSPDTDDVGVFLPYTPLHYLLLNHISPLVMTSGNRADEPIAKDENEIRSLLGSVADYALVHNRPVVRRCDDSVMKIVDGLRLFIRRSRGYVPDSLELPLCGKSILAVGAELKNTFCVTRDNRAFVSQHIGDLSERRNYRFFQEATSDLVDLLEVTPLIVAHDLHPDYLSTRYALDYSAERIVAVQHHHAHMAAVMAENRITEPVIGVSLDGSGYGTDGTIWGGEFLLGDLNGFERKAHFKQYPLPGGDEATLNPERMAYSCLKTDFEKDESWFLDILPGLDERQSSVISRMLEAGVNTPMTSSAGRLFDAVSAILGFKGCISYEGQAAIRLQSLADCSVEKVYSFSLNEGVVDFGDTVRAIADEMRSGGNRAEIAGAFHNTVVAAVVEVCEKIRLDTGVSAVTLSGGVFQNDILLAGVIDLLRGRGFAVYSHLLLPPNDACISFGQAAVALSRDRI